MRTLAGLAVRPCGKVVPRNCEYSSLKFYMRNNHLRQDLHGGARKSDFAVGQSSVENWVRVSFSGEEDGLVHVEMVIICSSFSVEPLDFVRIKSIFCFETITDFLLCLSHKNPGNHRLRRYRRSPE